ncbi:MAG: HAD family hydrolase [Actinobacteria bacterium]|nr:HAD family hydrolase [Actinomycetota bacterium]
MGDAAQQPGGGRRYAGVLFDHEGTLVDFQWRLAPAEVELHEAYHRLGYSGAAFANDNYATMWNRAYDMAAANGRQDELRATLYPVYDRWDADALTRWAPRPDAAMVLRRLAEAGVRVGMVSNIGRPALDVVLVRFDLARWLSPVVGRGDVPYMKPRPEGIRVVLDAWGVGPGEVLFVGDSRADVLGARAAGVDVAIIRGGECDESAFVECPPDCFVSALGELVGLVGL